VDFIFNSGPSSVKCGYRPSALEQVAKYDVGHYFLSHDLSMDLEYGKSQYKLLAELALLVQSFTVGIDIS
jgi:hypothetical protein